MFSRTNIFSDLVETHLEKAGKKLRLHPFETDLLCWRAQFYSPLYEKDEFCTPKSFAAAMIYFFVPWFDQYQTCKTIEVSTSDVARLICALCKVHPELEMKVFSGEFGTYRKRLFLECDCCQEKMLENTNKLRKMFKVRLMNPDDIEMSKLDKIIS
jgi:hypothetical protein